ncbi:MAG: type I methionyl aminopeptidase, partial [Myxococcales bacterium]|nr:type I methionyl aminopeptidase [Myxococcales bacterium]
MSNVSIKTVKEVNALRVASQMAADTLLRVGDMIRAGITTEDIDKFVHEDTVRRGAWPAPLNYHGFPKSV